MSDRPPADPGPAIAFDDAAGDVTFDAGAFASRYRAGPVLGRGGMGEVRTLADRASGREVAVKVVRADRRDPGALRRFAREARVQAQLEHPSIIPVYDLGRDPDGAPYFTMKRVDGRSLAEVLRADEPAFTLRKLLTVIARVAMALEYAHRRQVVHRDLKPANIMLGGFDEVYVLDWGLAQIRDPADGPLPGFGLSTPALTPPQLDDDDDDGDAGARLGTPGYQAPELLRARGPVDQRCDVYALGVILFEILTGERLHRGATLADVVISTLSLDGASPRARAPGRDIAPELDALVMACTRLAPGERPARARDVARAIDAYLDGDRDLVRRRALAQDIADRADRALAALRTGDEEARVRALREVTGALALDPDHPGARRTLVTLLAEPGDDMAAAEAAFEPAALRTLARTARETGLYLLSYAMYVPIVLWMGVRSWPAFAAMAAAIVAVIAGIFHLARRPTLRLPLWHVGLSGLALLAGGGMFGPLIVVPSIALITGVTYVSVFDDRRWAPLVMSLAVVVVPAALQLVGVLPASYGFVDGALVVRPGITWLPPVATWAFLLVVNITVVTAGVIYTGRLRRRYRELERRLRGQAWQLAQLVPDEARATLIARLTATARAA